MNPDALVIECMAVNPQYQWVSEQKIIKSTIGVLTNVRPDHLDEMGTTNREIAYSLSNTIPYNSICITSEIKEYPSLKKISELRKSEISQSDSSDINKKYLQEFPFLEHPENLSLALKVCESLGVDKTIALNGMKKTIPDPGALFILNLSYKNRNNNFISGFAANDPHSTWVYVDIYDGNEREAASRYMSYVLNKAPFHIRRILAGNYNEFLSRFRLLNDNPEQGSPLPSPSDCVNTDSENANESSTGE